MLVGVDHLVIAVGDPDSEAERLAGALGLMAGGGGDHPAWGTRNRLLWLGNTYVELLGLTNPTLAAGSWLGGPAVDALVSGPALVSWAIASDALDVDAAAMRERGAELGPVVPGERRRPDGRVVRWRLCLPSRISLHRPFLIEHDLDGAEWTADEQAERTGRPERLVSLALPVDGVAGLIQGRGSVRLDTQVVRAAGSSIDRPAITLAGLDGGRRSFDLVGCHWVCG